MELKMKRTKPLAVIANDTGLSEGYISRVFSGSRIPRVHNAKAIASSLGLTLDEFYDSYLKEHCERLLHYEM